MLSQEKAGTGSLCKMFISSFIIAKCSSRCFRITVYLKFKVSTILMTLCRIYFMRSDECIFYPYSLFLYHVV